MRYCAQCKTEYVQDMAYCPDCGSRLMDEQEWKLHMQSEDQKRTKLKGIKMASATPVSGRVEALQIQSILEQEGIPVFVRTFEETAYDGLFVSQKGWGEIWVAEDRLEEARRIVEELRKNQPEPASGE
jgi:hypothetical protein